MRGGSDRHFRRRRNVEDWIDRDMVLDSWLDHRRDRTITLFALAEPLRDQGYVAVGRRSVNGTQPRTVVLLRDGTDLESLDQGTEVPVLRRRARRAAMGRRAGSWKGKGS